MLVCVDDIIVKVFSSVYDMNMGIFWIEYEFNECDLVCLIVCLWENIMLLWFFGKIGNDIVY